MVSERHAQPDSTAFADVQTRIETLYLRRLSLEQEVRQLRATHPVICQVPPAPSILMRLLMRLVPRLRRRRERALVAGSGLFDAAWYLDSYPDVAQAGVDPLRHFLASGAAERRDPGPYFDTAHYLARYPDIAAGGMNPLVHYLRAGWREGRAIRPGMAEGRSGARA